MTVKQELKRQGPAQKLQIDEKATPPAIKPASSRVSVVETPKSQPQTQTKTKPAQDKMHFYGDNFTLPNIRRKPTKYSICNPWGGRYHWQLCHGFGVTRDEQWDEGREYLETFLKGSRQGEQGADCCL